LKNWKTKNRLVILYPRFAVLLPQRLSLLILILFFIAGGDFNFYQKSIPAFIFNQARAAGDGTVWYVRPGSGTYGNNTGASYANAWDGFASIVWGGTGINQGETLYICGTHIYGTDFSPNQNSINASGTEENPIVIRGDCPNDQGVIIGARKLAAGSFTNNGDGTFNTTFVFQAAIGIQGDPSTENGKLMWVVNSKAAVAAKDGSLWLDTTPTPDVLWVNPYGDTMEDIYTNYAGTALDLNGNDYITIRNLKLYAGAGNDGVLRLAKSDTSGANNINILNSEIGYGVYTGIYSGYSSASSNNILIEDTVIHRSKSGTYMIGNGGYQYSNWTFRRVEVYSGEDVNNIFGGGDRQAIGGQNLGNLLIEDSYIHDWAGEGIIDYMTYSASNPAHAHINMNNVTIRRNRIINLNDANDQNYHYGIAKHGDSEVDFAERSKNWQIYDNIFANLGGNMSLGGMGVDKKGVGAALRTKGGAASDGDVVKFYNNVVYNANYGIWILNQAGGAAQGITYTGGAGFNAKNNIFSNPKDGGYYFYVGTITGGPISVSSNNNLFYPEGINRFVYNGITKSNLSAWRTVSGQDANSLIGDPLFENIVNRDFRLKTGSPAINAGIDVGLTTDFAGNSIVGNPDIGAYEYTGTPPPVVCTPSWSCTPWSTCSASSAQTRTCLDTNACGVTTDKPAESQSCTYVPSTCTSFTYSSWSACQSNNTRSRTVLMSSPLGCLGGSPILSQSCTYAPPVTGCTPYWSCTSWPTCPASGLQTRTCTDTKACNVNTNKPIESQSCTYTVTTPTPAPSSPPPATAPAITTPAIPVVTLPSALVTGNLIKTIANPGIYYIGSDSKRHLFSNEATYWTWYSGKWSDQGVKTVSQNVFDLLISSANITARPGVNLIKFQNSPRVYVVTPNSILKEIVTSLGDDSVAKKFFGNDYAKRVIIIQDAFEANYTKVDPLDVNAKLPDGSLIKYSDSSTVYYINGGKRQQLSGTALTANNFKSDAVITVPASMAYPEGAAISSIMPELLKVNQ